MSDEQDKVTRKDVDELSAKILINFGIINAAALAATLADATSELNNNSFPFALGLLSAVISQVYWYFDTAIDYGLEGYSPFTNKICRDLYHYGSAILIIGTGGLSGGCLIYGCMTIMGFSFWCSIIGSLILVGFPFVLLFALAYKLRCLHENGTSE